MKNEKNFLEEDTEKYLHERVKTLGGKTRKRDAAKMQIRGTPDREVYIPYTPFDLVETKRPKGGRLSEEQRLRITEFKLCGIEVWLLSTRKEVDAYIDYKAAQQNFNKNFNREPFEVWQNSMLKEHMTQKQ